MISDNTVIIPKEDIDNLIQTTKLEANESRGEGYFTAEEYAAEVKIPLRIAVKRLRALADLGKISRVRIKLETQDGSVRYLPAYVPIRQKS